MQGDGAGGVVQFQHAFRAVGVDGITQPRPPRAPGAGVVAQRAADKAQAHLTGALHLHPRCAQHRAGVRARHGTAKPVQQQVYIMAAMTEKLPAAVAPRIGDPRAAAGVGILFRPDGDLKDGAVNFLADEPAHLYPQRVVAHHVADAEYPVRRLRGVQQFQALRLGDSQRLLHQHVLARRQASQAHHVMQIVRQRDEDGVHRVQHVMVVSRQHGLRRVRARARQLFLVNIHQRRYVQPALQGLQPLQERAGHHAAADHTESDHWGTSSDGAITAASPSSPLCRPGRPAPRSRHGAL
ncbi:MAG: hypothetical protein BWY76_01693 [bacterium ADurb.Bin429]|nr:MAG: hypothetical protein BWY76_01693 [bacterium ADurb.Bin429]